MQNFESQILLLLSAVPIVQAVGETVQNGIVGLMRLCKGLLALSAVQLFVAAVPAMGASLPSNPAFIPPPMPGSLAVSLALTTPSGVSGGTGGTVHMPAQTSNTGLGSAKIQYSCTGAPCAGVVITYTSQNPIGVMPGAQPTLNSDVQSWSCSNTKLTCSFTMNTIAAGTTACITLNSLASVSGSTADGTVVHQIVFAASPTSGAALASADIIIDANDPLITIQTGPATIAQGNSAVYSLNLGVAVVATSGGGSKTRALIGPTTVTNTAPVNSIITAADSLCVVPVGAELIAMRLGNPLTTPTPVAATGVGSNVVTWTIPSGQMLVSCAAPASGFYTPGDVYAYTAASATTVPTVTVNYPAAKFPMNTLVTNTLDVLGTFPGPVAATGTTTASSTSLISPGIGAGTLTVSKSLTGAPTSYTPAGSFNAYAICDLPVAGTRYPAAGFVSINVGAPAVINLIPATANCIITEDTTTRPAPPTNYKWSAPIYGQPPAIPAGGNADGTVNNPLTPLDPPFIKKSARQIDATTVEWTVTVINNNVSNAGQAPVAFDVTDALPANMNFIAGSLSCSPVGTPGQTTAPTCGFDATVTHLAVSGTLAYTADTDPLTASERVDIVFRGTSSPGATISNTACTNVTGQVPNPKDCSTAKIALLQLVPTLDARSLVLLVLMLVSLMIWQRRKLTW